MKDNLKFVDAQEKAKQYPGNFYAQTKELNEIKKGDYVKVCVEGERFWVLVTKVEAEVITGNIDNDLVRTRIHGLKDEDEISFEKKNVFNIIKQQL